MDMHVRAIHAGDVMQAVVIAALFILATSLMREPGRRNFNAIMIGGAGAAYLSGGFGVWEFAFAAVVTVCAYKGLHSYHFIAVGWLLHTAWDLMHHLYGNPIIPLVPTSSAGCAITDALVAIWLFAGAPSVFDLVRASPEHLTTAATRRQA